MIRIMKKSNPNREKPGGEGVGGSGRLEGRKVSKRRGKEKDKNTIVELVTGHFKEFNTTNNEMTQIVKDLVTVVGAKATIAKERDEE